MGEIITPTSMRYSVVTSNLVLAMLALYLLPDAAAQSGTGARGEAGLTFTVGSPQGEFGDQLSSTGFGGSLFGAVGLAHSPVLFGVDLGFLIYGREVRREPFSTTIPDVRVDVITTNNIFLGHLFLRLQPPTGEFRPYADALFGLKYLFTDTRIRSDGFNSNGDNTVARSTNFDDTALSYGFGAGVQFQVWDGTQRAKDSGPDAVYVDLGARYLFGSHAEYLQEGSVRRENGNVIFDVNRSKTDILNFRIGVGMRF